MSKSNWPTNSMHHPTHLLMYPHIFYDPSWRSVGQWKKKIFLVTGQGHGHGHKDLQIVCNISPWKMYSHTIFGGPSWSTVEDMLRTRFIYLWPQIVTLTFKIWTWILCMTHCFAKKKMHTELFENPSMYGGVIAQTQQNSPLFYLWPQFMTLTFKLWAWFLILTHCLA